MPKIKTIFKHLEPSIYKGRENLEIRCVVTDSRLVQKGDLFIAQKGANVDSHRFINDVLEKGAYVLLDTLSALSDPWKNQKNPSIFFAQNTYKLVAPIAKAYYADPDKNLTIIGITGTNGKTSTSYIIKAILEKAGQKVGLIGTIQYLIADKVKLAQNTTPMGLELYALLNEMKQENCNTVVMEISSHALENERCAGLELDVAIFTNLTQDHLDFHPTMHDYLQAKLKIFDLLSKSDKKHKLALINGQGDYKQEIIEASKNRDFETQTIGITEGEQKEASFSFKANILETSIHHNHFKVQLPNKESLIIQTPLQGYFNIQNTLMAIGATFFLKINPNIIKEALKEIHIKGRFENVTYGKNFAVIVDYAHTPDALKNILQTARSLNPNKIITVFGAGGDRDTSKRPLMGNIAYEYSDVIIITSDNPRSENPFLIIEQILSGIKKKSDKVFKEVNRKKAIQKALSLAKKNDIIIIAGKGHETYQIFKKQTVYFNDKETVLKILENLK